jgi:hypothetical protein
VDNKYSLYESVLSGCIPVIMADGMHLPFSFSGSGVDWRRFSVMIPESVVKGDVSVLKNMLLGLTDDDVLRKQQELRHVRKKMLYSKPLRSVLGQKQKQVQELTKDQKNQNDQKKPLEQKEALANDAFEMIILALREKARAMRYVSAKHGPGFWL